MKKKKTSDKKPDSKRRATAPSDDLEYDIGSMVKLQPETVDAIWAILFVVLAVFLLLAAFDGAGMLGSQLYGLMSYLFGVGYFLMPILLVMLGISFVKSVTHTFALPKVIGAFIFFVSGLSMVHLLVPGHGGVVGGFIASPIVRLVDAEATFLFLFAFLVISFIVMFDTPLHFKFIRNWLDSRKAKDQEDLQLASPKISGNSEEIVLTRKQLQDINTDKEKEDEPTPTREVSKPKEPVIAEETNTPTGGEFSIFGAKKSNSNWTPPPLSILAGDKGKPGVGDVKANANLIKRTLMNFGIPVEMDEITIGPTVTRYALKPAEGVKLSRIEGLQQNLALALAAQSIRMEAPIPGKSLVGIEIPNTTKTIVGLGTIIGSKEFQNSDKPLSVALGKNVSGQACIANLAKMPHLLIAGTTGSGKSVTVHALLTSLLYRNSPDMLKFIMVDAKRVELTLYNKIPHLLTPVITDAKKTIMALRWAAKEMDRRYDVLEKQSVRDITSYHKNVKEGEAMPYIVIVIDELADLMQSYPRELEGAIVRLAQMSRAVGIHLIISTQRPSVNVITGLIKANIPTRIALKVGSQIDSRTIIDRAGAEKLVGHGDMLYVSQDNPEPIRIQSPFIGEDEVKEVVRYFIQAYKDEAPPHDISLATAGDAPDKNAVFGSMNDGGDGEDDDELYEQARQIVIEAKKASTSYIQRKLRVGYARAARLMDMLEERGVIAPGDGAKPREVMESNVESSTDAQN